MAGLTPQEFVSRWRWVTLKERSASQSHFIDLCRLVDQPTPTEADPTGDFYTFECGAEKSAGLTGEGHGCADVWKKGHFAWEYKGPRANLDKAYQQLQQYRESLENPPLLVVSDLQTIQVHTNFTNSVKRVTNFALDDLLVSEKLDQLRRVWTDPFSFRAEETPENVTEQAAREFAGLAELLRSRGEDPDRAAHFLIRLLFASVRVLDPACGSSNFLYVSLKQLLDLEKEVINFGGEVGLAAFFPKVGPEQVHGIEINEYAHELATGTVWIYQGRGVVPLFPARRRPSVRLAVRVGRSRNAFLSVPGPESALLVTVMVEMPLVLHGHPQTGLPPEVSGLGDPLPSAGIV